LLGIVSNAAFALRLPSLLEGVLASIFAFVILRRRVPASYALTGMVGLAVFGHEWFEWARPYGLAFGCAAAALLCWQSARRSTDR